MIANNGDQASPQEKKSLDILAIPIVIDKPGDSQDPPTPGLEEKLNPNMEHSIPRINVITS